MTSQLSGILIRVIEKSVKKRNLKWSEAIAKAKKLKIINPEWKGSWQKQNRDDVPI